MCEYLDISNITILQDYVRVLPEEGAVDREAILDATEFTVIYNFRSSSALLTPPYQPSIIPSEPQFTHFPESPMSGQYTPGYNGGEASLNTSWDMGFVLSQPPCYSPLPINDYGCHRTPLLEMYDCYGKYS